MPSNAIAIIGGNVWPGSGPDLLPDHTVIAEAGRIVSVGPRESAVVPSGATVIDATGLTVIPGLSDAHVHLTTNSDESHVEDNSGYLNTTPPQEQALHGLRNGLRALCAGFTTVRVMGLRDAGEVEYRDFINRGLLFGPRMFVAPWWITMTNGHGDLFFPRNRVRRELDTADGPDEVRRLVRYQARQGADFIKVMASGGVMSNGDDPSWPNYSVEELRTIVEEAHSMDMSVAAHAHSAEGVRRCLAAGVDTIEHGTFMGPDELVQMKETGTFLIPTMSINYWLANHGANRGAGAGNVGKVRRVVVQQREMVQRAFEAGVRIVMGTDSSGDLCPFGEHAREIELYTEVGMQPYQALETATVGAAEMYGRAGELGVLAPGAVADAVVLDGNPLSDISVLRRPGGIRHVVKDGADLSALLGNDEETRTLRVPRMPVSE
jgi:imidazolonepropionase-like amidohydrolase